MRHFSVSGSAVAMVGRSAHILTLLPDEFILRIISFLDEETDRKSFRCVCRDFYRLDSLCREHIRVLRLDFVESLFSKLGSLTSLDFSVCPRFDDAAVAQLFSHSSPPCIWTRSVRKLTLARCSGLTLRGLGVMVKNCVSLDSLDISYCYGLGDLEATALSCAVGLRELILDQCLNISDVGLAKIALSCVKLETLSIKWCFGVTDLAVVLLSKKCAELKHLDLSYTKITSNSLRWISKIGKLESLRSLSCGSVDDICLHYIRDGCPSLQVLDISRCDKLSFPALASVVKTHNDLVELQANYCFSEIPVNFICYSNKLKVFSIDGAQVSSPTLKSLGQNCKKLIEIGLGKCRFTDDGIMGLVSGCPDLKILNLTCCYALSDIAICSIAESCKALVSLRLECCKFITEWSLYHLGSCCSFLRDVDLTDCVINDTGLKYLSKCSRCYNIGDNSLASLCYGCRKLQKLIISYCESVTDKGISFLSYLDELVDLELRGLLRFSSNGLLRLVAGCRRLSRLDLKHCPNIDDSGFLAMAYYSKNLQQINLSCSAISNARLRIVMGNLTCLQDAKLVNLSNVTVDGIEVALRVCCSRLKKLKLAASLQLVISYELINILEAKGCRVRWI